jgi:hypothetical protein
MINNVFVSMVVVSGVFGATAEVSPRRPYWTDHVGKLDALIGSENTYGPAAGVDISRRRGVAQTRG